LTTLQGAGPLLDVRSVTTEVEIQGRHWPVVRDVSFTIGRGEVVGIVGESGSGKSMTARTILRLLPPGARTTGHVLLEGVDLLALGKKELREVRA
jgi:ABC-type glutathione transport system ATPase component